MKCEVLCMWIHIFRNYRACNLTIFYKFFTKEMTIMPSFVLCKYGLLYIWSCNEWEQIPIHREYVPDCFESCKYFANDGWKGNFISETNFCHQQSIFLHKIFPRSIIEKIK